MTPSFVNRLLGKARPTADAVHTAEPGAFGSAADAKSNPPAREYFDITDAAARLEAVGESHYQQALRSVIGGWPHDYVVCEVLATLVAEPGNPYDSNAIAVRVEGNKVAHLARRDAAAYQGLFAQLRTEHYLGASCRAVICGGDSDRPSLGIFLRAADPRSAERQLRCSDLPLPPVAQLVTSATERQIGTRTASTHGSPQTLWCERGQHTWERAATRGRVPRNCPEHQ